MMEADLAGWSNKVGALFSRRKAPTPKAKSKGGSAVVQPLVREGQARVPQRDPLPRFHAMASDQYSGRGGDRFAGMRTKLRQAFTPSQPVADRRMFAGRHEILKTLIQAIEDQRLHTVIYGERGIGKTSLLHMLSTAGREARYIVVYSSCGANATFDEIFRAAAADVPLLFHSGFAPTTAEAERGSSIADLLPPGQLTPHKFADLCAKLTGTRVLMILDEFDRCESVAFRRDVAELIKNLSDRLGRVQLVLAGVAADLTELVEHIPSIRRNIFAMRVPRMPDAEIMQIVANGERETNLVFDGAASASVVAVALGSPYIANLLCHHAGHNALDDGRSTVLLRDVANAVDRVVAEFQDRIPHGVIARVRHLFDTGAGESLAAAARAALSVDGTFSIAELQVGGRMDQKQAQQIVQLLTAERLVKTADENGELRAGFTEEGLPIFLWLFWAQRNMTAEVATPRATARAAATTT